MKRNYGGGELPIGIVVQYYVVYSRFTPASYFHQSICCGYLKHTQSVAPGAIINGRLNFENTAERT